MTEKNKAHFWENIEGTSKHIYMWTVPQKTKKEFGILIVVATLKWEEPRRILSLLMGNSSLTWSLKMANIGDVEGKGIIFV